MPLVHFQPCVGNIYQLPDPFKSTKHSSNNIVERFSMEFIRLVRRIDKRIRLYFQWLSFLKDTTFLIDKCFWKIDGAFNNGTEAHTLSVFIQRFPPVEQT